MILPIAEDITSEWNKIDGNSAVLSSNPEALYYEYLDQKTALKYLLRRDPIRTQNALDRHKVSACLTTAITRVRMLDDLKFDETRNDNSSELKDTYNVHRDSFRGNEQLAFFSGIAVLSMYMASKGSHNKSDHAKIVDALNSGFVYPMSMHGTESDPKTYLGSMIRGLYYSKISYGLNPILLANIFFLLERHFYLVHGFNVGPIPEKWGDDEGVDDLIKTQLSTP